jgi:inositol-1,3,4-trisphosphate 5/6-kinase/inositol-tetrakisphosphate 1-kinase
VYAFEEEKHGVRFEVWDPTVPVDKQPKFDVIVHKLTEELCNTEEAGETTQVNTIDKIACLGEYLAANPTCKIIDPIAAVLRVMSREVTCKTIAEITENKSARCDIRQPAWFVTKEWNAASIIDLMRRNNIDFPVICKPVVGCGTPSSHQLVIAVSQEGLALQLSTKGTRRDGLLVQKFHNHGGYFLKVYVIDDDVMVFKRPSLPNLSSPQLRSIEFDSRFAYPTIDDFLPDNSITTETVMQARGGKGFGDPLPALDDKLRSVASAIRKEFGLSLFGFDVIVPCDGDGEEILVVDVNYFPSFKEVVDFPRRFFKFCRDRSNR